MKVIPITVRDREVAEREVVFGAAGDVVVAVARRLSRTFVGIAIHHT